MSSFTFRDIETCSLFAWENKGQIVRGYKGYSKKIVYTGIIIGYYHYINNYSVLLYEGKSPIRWNAGFVPSPYGYNFYYIDNPHLEKVRCSTILLPPSKDELINLIKALEL